ncbi:MAG: proprotein convertase P-domain-containing protein [Acidobacteriota bacterium]|nr:MAG: proprotein convertase P-domain-containing protein [Acidobacteriota bacterium]
MLIRTRRHGLRAVLTTLPALVALAALGPTPLLAAGRGEPGPLLTAKVELVDEDREIALLSQLDIDIDAVFDGWARVFLIAEELDKLRSLGFVVTVSEGELPGPGPVEPSSAGALDVPAEYHTYATLTADLQQIAADHAEITELISLGTSVQGRELWMMLITDEPHLEQDEPAVVYIAAMHGDEVVGKELCFNLIDHLTDNYGSDSRVTELVNSTEIWIMPSMNPDGTAMSQRYNANSYDLNRDFPDQFVDPVNTPEGRQPETAAVMMWAAANTVSLGGSYHGGTLVVNYPFDNNESGSPVYSPTSDDDLFVSVSRTYADNNPPLSTSNSHPSYDGGICNGADWYTIHGGIQDWSYVWHGGPLVTLEISNTKWPAPSTLPGFWDDNLESMLSYMERVHEGLRGTVIDAVSGSPLAARVSVEGNPIPSTTDPEVGDYHRPLMPGRYALEVAAAGYSSALIDEVIVGSGPAARYDVALEPLATELQPVDACADVGEECSPWLQAGETADLRVTLRNLGLDATSVSGRLEPTGWLADVVRAEASYPDIPAGQQGESIAPHHGVSVSADAPEGHKLGFFVHGSSEQGTDTSEPFFVPIGEPSCVELFSADVPKSILDRTTTESSLDVLDELELTGLEVSVDITHPYRGDLRVELVTPAESAVTLHGRSGGSADDIVGTYGVDLAPFEPLSRAHGESSLGPWRLRIRDGVPSNAGTLNSWSLRLCGRPFEAIPPEMRLRSVSRSEAAVQLEWWRYPGLIGYRVYRSSDASASSAFDDVTAEDDDPTDTRFLDASSGPILYWLITGVSSRGEGPWGHFGR